MNRLIWVSLLFFIITNHLNAATEYATFESFYVESSMIGWLIAGALAIVAGAVVFFTGGTASPIVIGLGTSIGNLAGLSGIAATNYGLALLGGGAISAGGLGVAGGVAVLTAALTFSTEVVIDYSLGKVYSAYSYSNFVENSKTMTTLPIPQNEDGSKVYEEIVEKLKEDINSEKPLHDEYNQKIIKHYLFKLENSKFQVTKPEHIKNLTLFSLLNFLSGNYVNAKYFADKAIDKARQEEIKRTLPAFIFAVSSLYDQSFNFKDINENYFRHAVLAEPDNKLIPLMFAIYLDRILYRMNDDENDLDFSTLNRVKDIAFEIEDEDLKAQSLLAIMARYLIRMKIEQQKIISLSHSDNKKLIISQKTEKILKDSLEEYIFLINSSRSIIESEIVLEMMLKDEKIKDLKVTFANYEEDISNLKLRIETFLEKQSKTRIETEKAQNQTIIIGAEKEYLNQGVAFQNKKQYSNAISEYTKAIEVNISYTLAYYYRGLALAEEKDYDSAIEDFTKAILIDSTYALAYSSRGLMYNKKKEYTKAISDFCSAIEIDPKLTYAYYNRGVAYYNGEQNYLKASKDAHIACQLGDCELKTFMQKQGTLK